MSPTAFDELDSSYEMQNFKLGDIAVYLLKADLMCWGLRNRVAPLLLSSGLGNRDH